MPIKQVVPVSKPKSIIYFINGRTCGFKGKKIKAEIGLWKWKGHNE